MGRVLIVDDHEDIRRMFARAVKACGHEALTAPDGEEGIATATEQRPALVILDLMMPGITGFDVLRSLRADPRTRDGAIVIFSALNDPEFVEQALSLGADDYWVKGTFSMETLEQWLTYYLVDGKR
jgi:two-component system phosphate regulon response regulator PhoB